MIHIIIICLFIYIQLSNQNCSYLIVFVHVRSVLFLYKIGACISIQITRRQSTKLHTHTRVHTNTHKIQETSQSSIITHFIVKKKIYIYIK